MANEASVRSGLSVRKLSGSIVQVDYQSRPEAFSATVTGSKGPVPGAFAATIAGVDVVLSELTQPGLCRIKNLDATNFITVGIWEPDTAKFYPLIELLAGESYVMRLSRLLSGELGTGAGTTGSANNTLRVKADTAPANVLVEAFET